MKRHLRPDEIHLWAHVASTVHPAAGRKLPTTPAETPPVVDKSKSALGAIKAVAKPAAPKPAAARPAQPVSSATQPIEPGRKRRIVKGRENLEARIDLHGLDYVGAQAALEAFVRRAWNDGYRACLVITGKGSRGGGVLRRHTPEWLASPGLRDIVAGISEADRRHGGEGAIYVALKRKVRA
jgi:DNA-nicking Smr family endonuclease